MVAVANLVDLIVVGAGPAGSTAARRAAELGLSTVLVDRATFPRPKHCAAGLTDRALGELRGAEAPVMHRRTAVVRLSCGSSPLLSFTGEGATVATTTRRELDNLLLEQAASSGADVACGVRVATIEQEDGRVVVAGGRWRMSSRYAVVADGARGTLRVGLGLPPLRLCGAGYVRAYPGTPSALEPFADEVRFDLTASVRGYGWIFPKSDHLNIGVFSQRPLSRELLGSLRSYVELLGVTSWRLEGPFAFPIPLRRRRESCALERVLLAGDAAALVDPITGEGISYAVMSGRIAAEAVAENMSGSGSEASTLYARRVNDEVVPMATALSARGNLIYALGRGFLLSAARNVPVRASIVALWRMGRSARAGRLRLLHDVPV